MDLHRALGDSGRKQVVLDLLVSDEEDHHPHSRGHVVEGQGHQCGEDRCQIGADHRHELAENPHPDPQGESEGDVEQAEEDRGHDGGEDSQDQPRVDVTTHLLHRHVPDVQGVSLTAFWHGGKDCPLQLGELGDHVEGEESHRGGEEDESEETRRQPDDATCHQPGQILDRFEHVPPHLEGIDLGDVEAEGFLEEQQERLDQPRYGLDQLTELLDEQRRQRPDEPEGEDHGHQKHDAGGTATSPAPLRQEVDRRLECDCHEHGHEDHEDDRSQGEEEPEGGRHADEHEGHDQGASHEHVTITGSTGGRHRRWRLGRAWSGNVSIPIASPTDQEDDWRASTSHGSLTRIWPRPPTPPSSWRFTASVTMTHWSSAPPPTPNGSGQR